MEKNMSIGGYRPGSGRSKSGYYKGIYCGSTYELCWLIHALDNGIKFTRFEGVLTDGDIKYIPDFILDDSTTIIELKGYEEQESVDRKTKLAEKLGYKVIVLRKTDLQPIFEHVEKKFGTKKFYTLYDGYKPKYGYECGRCKKMFSADKKKKTTIVFCSKSCSMLQNRLNFPGRRELITPEPIEVTREKNRIKHNEYYEKHRSHINERRRELYHLKKYGPFDNVS
jgi:hypothetical protein